MVSFIPCATGPHAVLCAVSVASAAVVPAAVAQFERELIRERVAAGIRSAKARGTKTGRPIGRPRRIFDRGEVVQLRQNGLSVAAIARQMKLGVGTVVRVLRSPLAQDGRGVAEL